MTLLREFAVLVVTLILVFVTGGAIVRGEMILAPPAFTAQAIVIALDAVVLVALGVLVSGGRDSPRLPNRLFVACVVAAALLGIGVAGAWLWVNLPDQRVQVLTGLLGVGVLGIIVIEFGSEIGGLPHALTFRWEVVIPAIVIIGTPLDILLTWRFIDYPWQHQEVWHYVWTFLVALFPFALLDAIWIKTVMEKMYKAELKGAVLGYEPTDEDKEKVKGKDKDDYKDEDRDEYGRPIPTHPRLGWGFLTWLVICGGLAAFAIVPHAIEQDLRTAVAWAAGFGFVTSAFYALTCLTALKSYVFKLAVYDVVWGTILAIVITVYTRAAV